MNKEDAKSSLFFDLKEAPKIPLAIVEGIFYATKDQGDKTSVAEVLLSVGVKEEDLEHTATAITEWFNSKDKKNTSKSTRSASIVGTALQDVYAKASFTDICLYLSSFSVIQARQLYTREDFRVVLRAYELMTGLEMAKAFTQHEAVGLAFGGGGGGSGDETVIDVTSITGVISG